MSRLGKIVSSSFENKSGVCTMSAIRVMDQYKRWSKPIFGVDKKYFLYLLLTDIYRTDSGKKQIEESVVINNGKINVKLNGEHEPSGVVVPQFVDAETGEIVDYDAVEIVSIEEATYTGQTYDAVKNELLEPLFKLIEKYADIPEEGGEDYRIILKFCEF